MYSLIALELKVIKYRHRNILEYQKHSSDGEHYLYSHTGEEDENINPQAAVCTPWPPGGPEEPDQEKAGQAARLWIDLWQIESELRGTGCGQHIQVDRGQTGRADGWKVCWIIRVLQGQSTKSQCICPYWCPRDLLTLVTHQSARKKSLFPRERHDITVSQWQIKIRQLNLVPRIHTHPEHWGAQG